MRLRLAAIFYGCDFRKNERTLWDEFRKEKKYKGGGDLKTGETVLLVSRGEDQLVWLFASILIPGFGDEVTLTDSRKWRLGNSRWNPDMLGEYAQMVDIELTGIRMFKDAYAEARKRKAVHRADPEVPYESHVHISHNMGMQ